MTNASLSAPFDLEAIKSVVASIFSELNIGLLIYHLDDPDDPTSLRLLYANRAASEYTGADLTQRIDKRILEAFPGLVDTDLPALYAEVVTSSRSRNIGAFEYKGDDAVESAHYAVKAFPMPNACVGIVFENITTRKRLEQLVKKLRDQEAKH